MKLQCSIFLTLVISDKAGATSDTSLTQKSTSMDLFLQMAVLYCDLFLPKFSFYKLTHDDWAANKLEGYDAFGRGFSAKILRSPQG